VLYHQTQPLPTLHAVETKEKELVDALQYHYKDEDIAHIVQEKKRFNKDRTKVAQRKIELNKLKVMPSVTKMSFLPCLVSSRHLHP
jgi:hypothetical protein